MSENADRFALGRVGDGRTEKVLSSPRRNRNAYRRVLWFSVCNPTPRRGRITIRLSRRNGPTIVLTTVDMEAEQTLYWKDLQFLLGPRATDAEGLLIECSNLTGHYAVLYRDEKRGDDVLGQKPYRALQ